MAKSMQSRAKHLNNILNLYFRFDLSFITSSRQLKKYRQKDLDHFCIIGWTSQCELYLLHYLLQMGRPHVNQFCRMSLLALNKDARLNRRALEFATLLFKHVSMLVVSNTMVNLI